MDCLRLQSEVLLNNRVRKVEELAETRVGYSGSCLEKNVRKRRRV